MFSLKKKVEKKRGDQEEVGNAGLLRVIYLVSWGPHNLDVTIFSVQTQIYNLPAKEIEMPNLLLGGECWELLKGLERGEDSSSENSYKTLSLSLSS